MLLLGIRIVHPVKEITIQLTAFLSRGLCHLLNSYSPANHHSVISDISVPWFSFFEYY